MEQRDSSIPDALRLQPGQQSLTPEQEAEARLFAAERIQEQLSTEPVDEQEAEELLKQAYQVVGLAPPSTTLWLDGPLQLIAALEVLSLKESLGASVWANVMEGARASGEISLDARLRARIGASLGASLIRSVWANIMDEVWSALWPDVGANIFDSMQDSIEDRLSADPLYHFYYARASIGAYENANHLAFYRFFDSYLAPNDLHALAHFNELVSGYWLGTEGAVIVRRPRILSLDEQGLLHSASGKCIEYHDGWGFYSWHGVIVPEKVILAPETLTREDFLNEKNAETRRIIQERTGDRSASELGGYMADMES